MSHLFLLMCIAVLLLPAPARGWTLPDTGQTKCYDNTQEIPCPSPGQPFYGQDGNYQRAQPSYQDNGDGTVTDLNTGLMWQKATDGIKRNWADAKSYCTDLRLHGYADWRMPSITELVTITNYGSALTACPTALTCNNDISYFSSIEGPDDNTVYSVVFVDGNWGEYGATSLVMLVRCVRGNHVLF